MFKFKKNGCGLRAEFQDNVGDDCYILQECDACIDLGIFNSIATISLTPDQARQVAHQLLKFADGGEIGPDVEAKERHALHHEPSKYFTAMSYDHDNQCMVFCRNDGKVFCFLDGEFVESRIHCPQD